MNETLFNAFQHNVLDAVKTLPIEFLEKLTNVPLVQQKLMGNKPGAPWTEVDDAILIKCGVKENLGLTIKLLKRGKRGIQQRHLYLQKKIQGDKLKKQAEQVEHTKKKINHLESEICRNNHKLNRMMTDANALAMDIKKMEQEKKQLIALLAAEAPEEIQNISVQKDVASEDGAFRF